MNSNNTGRKGVNKTENAILNMGWIFRAQDTSDYGIDALIEIQNKDEYPSGKLIALQIKTGTGYFYRGTDENVHFSGELKHLNYWLQHSLPVLVVLYNPDTDELIWEQITKDKVEINKKSWSFKIFRQNKFDSKNSGTLKKIAENIHPETRKLNLLKMSLPIMEQLNDGKSVLIEFEDWVNKSLSIRSLAINIYDDDGNFENTLETIRWPFKKFPDYDYQVGFNTMFPWADIGMTDTDDDETLQEFKDEYGIRENNHIDWDLFEEWKRTLTTIRPYSELQDEVKYYRIQLQLNEIGKSFLCLNEYLKWNDSNTEN